MTLPTPTRLHLLPHKLTGAFAVSVHEALALELSLWMQLTGRALAHMCPALKLPHGASSAQPILVNHVG